MTLKETVSQIKGYEVSETQARMFASEQFGFLASHIRGKFIDSFNLPKVVQEKQRRIQVKPRELPKFVVKTKSGKYMGRITINKRKVNTKTSDTIEGVLEQLKVLVEI